MREMRRHLFTCFAAGSWLTSENYECGGGCSVFWGPPYHHGQHFRASPVLALTGLVSGRVKFWYLTESTHLKRLPR